jgi:hypothetical protein
VQLFELSLGEAHGFYFEATSARCTAALMLDIDPLGFLRIWCAPAGDFGNSSGKKTENKSSERGKTLEIVCLLLVAPGCGH